MNKRIFIFSENCEGSCYYRCELYQRYSERFDIVSNVDFKEQNVRSVDDVLPLMLSSDCVVFLRPTEEKNLRIVKRLKKKGVLVICDNDDLFSSIDPGNPSSDKKEKSAVNIEFARSAHATINSTECLCREIGQHNPESHVFPNMIDSREFSSHLCEKQKNASQVRIAITGSVFTEENLSGFMDILSSISLRVPEAFFVFFGEGVNIRDKVESELSSRCEFIDKVAFTEYPATLASLDIDLCVIPRRDNLFNRCKSSCKYLEMASLKIPVVAQGFAGNDSPYESVIEDGVNGCIAYHREDWIQRIVKLCENIDFRKGIAEAAFLSVRDFHDIKKGIYAWDELVGRLLEHTKMLQENNRYVPVYRMGFFARAKKLLQPVISVMPSPVIRCLRTAVKIPMYSRKIWILIRDADSKVIMQLLKKFVTSVMKNGIRGTMKKTTRYLKNKLSKSTVWTISSDEAYAKWIRTVERPHKERALENIDTSIEKFSVKPLISLVMPVYNSDEIYLRKALFSVLYQYYDNWELCVVDDCSDKKVIRKILSEFSTRDSRVRVRFLEQNAGISRATNEAVSMAGGEYILFVDHDDELAPDALYCAVRVINGYPDVDFIYSDNDIIDAFGKRKSPRFKPDWSPELLLSYAYTSHMKLVRKSWFERLGGFRFEYDGSQDYDFFLRLSEHTDRVAHIPEILYHWREVPGSVALSADEKPESIERGRRAVQDALIRRGIRASVGIPAFAEEKNVAMFKINYHRNFYNEPVTIIIPTRDRADLLSRCVSSIQKKTDYEDYRILIVSNNSTEKKTWRYLNNSGVDFIEVNTDEFNFSYLINTAVDNVYTELVLFLNNDTEIISDEWLLQMVGTMSLHERIGAVGAKLLYPDRTIQHAGVIMGGRGLASHAGKGSACTENGYLAYYNVLKNYSAATAACLLTRKSLFHESGGFDENMFSVSYNDVDFCLKLAEMGYRTVFNPHAVLYHYEGKTRGRGVTDEEYCNLRNKWKEYIERDPYYNKNMEADHAYSTFRN